MVDKILNDSKIYTDVQGLSQLRSEYKNNPELAKTEIAQQFESMLMQMVMRSMREANKTFDSGLFSSDQMDFYQDMFDKQLALSMSNGGNGFASEIKKNMEQQFHLASLPEAESAPAITTLPVNLKSEAKLPLQIKKLAARKEIEHKETIDFSSPEHFAQSILPYAKQAAAMLGVDPKILIAQAALETNWGKKIVGGTAASHNLFNIKASTDWDKKTVTATTLEEKNGLLFKEQAHFKSYDSFAESFADYVETLKAHARYQSALTQAKSPEQFAQALQTSGFATDKDYAAKIMSIFDSSYIKELIR